MLRVTILREGSVETWDLEGKLSGEWVKELERCWKASTPEPGVTVQLNLKAVTYIDASGKKLLTEMYEGGVDIKGCGCMGRAVAEEIVRDGGAKGPHGGSKKVLAVIAMLVGAYLLGGFANLAAHEKSFSRFWKCGAREQVPQSEPIAVP